MNIVFVIISKGFSRKANIQIIADTFLELISTMEGFQAKGLASVVGRAAVIHSYFGFYGIVYSCTVSPMTGQQKTCHRCVDMGKDVGTELWDSVKQSLHCVSQGHFIA